MKYVFIAIILFQSVLTIYFSERANGRFAKLNELYYKVLNQRDSLQSLLDWERQPDSLKHKTFTFQGEVEFRIFKEDDSGRLIEYEPTPEELKELAELPDSAIHFSTMGNDTFEWYLRWRKE